MKEDDRMYSSKYFNKTHEEITYLLDEYACWSCGHWFMADISFCKTYEDPEDGSIRAILICPYCGKQTHRAI